MKNKKIMNMFGVIIIVSTLILTGCKRTELIKATAISDVSQSIWMWDASKEMSPSGIEALKKLNVDTVYLNTGWDTSYKELYLKEHELKYAMFMDSANQADVNVQALLSESNFALSKYYNDLESQVKIILNYNKEYKYRFTAVHFDIEPYLFKDWDNKIENYLSSYLENLQKIKELIDNHNLKEKDNLILAIDIPFWYYQDKYNVKGTNIVDLLLQTVDEINVMDYTQNQTDFVNWGKEVLSIADNYPNKTVKIAFELDPNEKDITLYKLSPDELIKYVGDSVKEFEQYSSYKGISIHNYDSYMSYLKENDIIK